MRTLIIISILVLFTGKIHSQELRIINTKDLIPIAKEFGIDSALHLSASLPIYVIDSLTAKSLLEYVTDYKRYTSAEYFFNQMAHNWKTQFLKDKTSKLLKIELEKLKHGKPDQYGNLIKLDDKLIISLLIQRPDSIEKPLIDCYWSCSRLADSLKASFPSGISRFFSSFKYGTHPTVEAYQYCNLNCYNIMRILGQLKSNYFNSKKLNYHKYKFPPWLESEDIFRFKDTYHEYDIKLVSLNRQYNSLNEIDFANEPELKNILSEYNIKDKCWKFMLSNEKQGILNVGCRFAPLAGHGMLLKLELQNDNRLRICKIGEWIS
jgi:hypothetical protein